MTKFSWRQWLHGTYSKLVVRKRRRLDVSQTRAVEGLEERTLLTAPLAVDDSGYVANEDQTLNGSSVLGNDTDADDDIDSAMLGTGPSHAASFTLNTDGTFTYTPVANFHGIDSFTYYAVDTTPELSNLATVTITVGQVDDAGTFGGDVSGSGAEDNNITGTLTFADAIDGFASPDFAVTGAASHGTASIDSTTGEWSYSPTANYHGSDSFTVSVTDDDGNVESQVINLTITQVNDAGTFGGDVTGSGAEDNDITGTVTFTDAIDGFTTPDFAVTGVAAHGTASIDATTGEWSYSPNANYHGADSFTISVTDNDGNVENQLITLTITQVDDAGAFGGDVSGTGAEDNAITGTLTFTDAIDGFTTPDFAVTGVAAHGTASIDATTGEWSYSPNANYHGADSFTVSVTDNDGNVASQVIVLTITQVNDAGTFGGDVSGSGSEDSDITGTLTFADAIDGFTTPDFAVTVVAAHGTASIDATTGEWSYSPHANYHGADSFTVSVTDDDGNVETQVIHLTVTQVDDAGTFGGDVSGSGAEDTDITGTLTFADAIDGFTTPDFAVTGAASHGVASIDATTGEWTYSPHADYHGADSFTVSVTDDDGNVASQVIVLTITQVNDAGTFGGDVSGSGSEDSDITGTLTFADGTDGDTTPNFTVIGTAAHGVASIDATTGEWSYSPNANYHGADSFTVSVTDDDGNVETQVINLTVTQVNDAGVFGGDVSGSGAEDSDITGTLTFADAIDGFTTADFAVTVVAAHGTASIDATTGEWTYSPNANYHGADSFTVSVTDDDGNVETQVITLTITQVNDAGVFGGDVSGSGAEDTDITGTLTFADAIDGFTTPDFAVTGAAAHGTATIDATTGEWSYSPNANYNGTDSFTVSVTDNDGNVETQVINVTITAVNDAPVANSATFTVSKNFPLSGTLSGSDVDNDQLTFAPGAGEPAHGTVVINANGTFVYTPDADYFGTDSFTFVVNDGTVDSAEATITINVANNLAPSVNGDSISTDEDTPFDGVLTGSDPESDTLTYYLGAVHPSHGTVVINQDGTYTYTPAANYHGTDSFTFYVNDGLVSSAEATIAITVVSVNDAPVATSSSFSTDEDTAYEGTLSATDVDGDSLTYHVGTVTPNHGSVTINLNGTYTYTPAANYNGPDQFSFFVNDGTADSQEVLVTVTVDAVNDAPVGDATSFTTAEDTPYSGTLTGTDIDGDSLTFHAGGVTPSHGVVTINADGTFTYTPAANYHGADSFSFIVNDGDLNSVETTVTVTVTAVNDAPVADASSFTVNEDTPYSGALTATDVDGDALAYFAGSTAPSHGSVIINLDGTFTYTPAANYHGSDTFSFYVNDGTVDSAEVVVTVTIDPVNDAPVADASSFSTDEDTLYNGVLSGTDVEGDSLTYFAGTVTPAHGTVTVNANGTFTYTPAANYHGTDTFSFYVNDGSANSVEAVVTVTIHSVNDAPVANAGTFSVRKNDVLQGTLTASDVDGDAVTYLIGATQPAHGTVVINLDGTFTYTPEANYFGTDTFSFKVNDGTVDSTEATVTITVANNELPTANADSIVVTEDVEFNGTLTGADTESDPLTYHLGSLSPAHGTVVIALDGTYSYTPAANYHGTDSFTFYVNDGLGNSVEATISITVNPVNDAPVANGSSFITDEDTPHTGTLTGTDVDGDALVFSAGTVAPSHGNVTINANGTYTYTPAANYHGTDTFSFKVNDGTVNSTEAFVTITINSINDAPTVTNGAAAVNEDAVLNGSVSPLGVDIEGDALTYTLVTAPTHGTLVLSPDGTFVYTPFANYSGTDSFAFKANDGSADSNVAIFTLTVTSIDDPLVLNLPGGTIQVARNNVGVPIDSQASVSDPDTTINYANAQIRSAIVAGGTAADNKNGRVSLKILSQGTGAGLVKVKGSKIYFNGSKTPIGTFTGGTKGRPLVITFNSGATEQAVNAVLKLISLQTSKKASAGMRQIGLEVSAGGQTALGFKFANVN